MKKKLIIIFIILLICYSFLEMTKTEIKSKDYNLKVESSNVMLKSIEVIKEKKILLGIPIDKKIDINETGLIGEEFNDLTTTYGNLESKRTSINPNLAAVVVDMLKELGLEKGDKIAINFSSSFPSVNIAVLSAIEVTQLDPVIISSVGSSTYGGNNIDFTYLDMENYLYKEGIISNNSSYYSLGGDGDVLGNREVINGVIDRIKSYGVTLIYEENLQRNIEKRIELYGEDIKCFINVGGNIVSFGKGSALAYVGGGIIKDIESSVDDLGLAQHYLRNNIPVIHFLNIKDIALEYGLPIDPKDIEEIGKSNVFYEYKYNKTIILITIAFIAFLIKR